MNAYEVRFYDLAQLADPRAVLSPDPFVRATIDWVGQALRKKPGDGALCLNCNAEWHGEHTWSVVVIMPFTKQSKQTLVSGICPACAAKPSLYETALNSIRHGAFGGDLQILQAPGTA